MSDKTLKTDIPPNVRMYYFGRIRDQQTGAIDHAGVLTVAAVMNETNTEMKCSFVLCSPNDEFKKEHAQMMALGRLIKNKERVPPNIRQMCPAKKLNKVGKPTWQGHDIHCVHTIPLTPDVRPIEAIVKYVYNDLTPGDLPRWAVKNPFKPADAFVKTYVEGRVIEPVAPGSSPAAQD